MKIWSRRAQPQARKIIHVTEPKGRISLICVDGLERSIRKPDLAAAINGVSGV